MKKEYYKRKIEENKLPTPYLTNGLWAFLFGGIIAIIGQVFIELYKRIGFDLITSQGLMSVTLILISSILTGFGIYDKIGQYGKAGTIIPITGFANSMTSAALEGKQEGIVLGIGTGLFKLAGSVITFGVVAAYVLGMIRYLVEL